MSTVLEELLSDFEKKISLATEDFKGLRNVSKKMIDQLKSEKDYNDKIVDTFKKYQVVDSDIIRLNVGGSLFSTLKSTLNKKIKNPSSDEFYKPNILEGLVNGYIEPKYDENNSIFIDRNPKYFSYILDYLRMANTENELEFTKNFDMKDLIKEAQYYNIEGLIELMKPGKILNSEILDQTQVESLLELCGFSRKIKWNLLYMASKDGFSANSFHSKCDGSPMTLTIVESSNGYVFGGYSDLAWQTSSNSMHDPNSFIFSLINSHDKPTKMSIRNSQYGIYHDESYGPTFGGGHDLYICNESNSCNSSYSGLGSSYIHPKYAYCSAEAQSYLAGSYNFTVSNIEVFQKSC